MSSLSTAATPARAADPPLRVSNLGDELLARYAARGSDRAFAAIYERYHQRLYRYCRSILRDDMDAQDALQSTFMGALSALRRSQRNAPLRPWLYKIAHNEAISLLRRRTRDAADELPVDTLGSPLSIEQEVVERAQWRTLVEDLGRLPDRLRGALLLRELSGLSHEEIGIALGTSTAGAKQAIFEARQALGEIEEGRAMSCEEVRRRISEGDRRVLRGRRVTAHLRECAACEAFAVAIPARRTQLNALTPALPPAAAAVLLSRSLRSASAHGGVGGSAAAAGISGKVISVALTWKALATGVAIVATTAASAAGLVPGLHSSAPSRSTFGQAAGHGARSTAGHGASTVQRTLRAGSTRSTHLRLAADHHRSAASHRQGSTSTTGASSHSNNGVGLRARGNPTRGNSVNAPGHTTMGRGHTHHTPSRGSTRHSSSHRIGVHSRHSTGKHLGVRLPPVPVHVLTPKVHTATGQTSAQQATVKTS